LTHALTRAPFGTTPAGDHVESFTLTNAHGIVVRATNYGGIVVSLLAPDRDGRLANVVLGHDSLQDYLSDRRYLGAIVGRYANRIAGARFTLGDDLPAGRQRRRQPPARRPAGFDRVAWRADPSPPVARSGRAGLHQPRWEEATPGRSPPG
jgi:aldose 1-epimerase